MEIHTTREGKKIRLRDMTDSHLAATIRLFERRAKDGVTVRMGGGSCAEDIWYDEDTLSGEEALDRLGYADYVKERDRRISNAACHPRLTGNKKEVDMTKTDSKAKARASRSVAPACSPPAHELACRMLNAIGWDGTNFRLRDPVALVIAPEVERINRRANATDRV